VARVGQELLVTVSWKVIPLFDVRITDVDVCARIVGSEEATFIGSIVVHCAG